MHRTVRREPVTRPPACRCPTPMRFRNERPPGRRRRKRLASAARCPDRAQRRNADVPKLRRWVTRWCRRCRAGSRRGAAAVGAGCCWQTSSSCPCRGPTFPFTRHFC
eukprot:4995003-Prymnesium_polylepis.1